MNNPPTSFVSFKKLATAPTIPAPTIPAPTTTVSMIKKTSYIDYAPLVVGLGVVYMMFKY